MQFTGGSPDIRINKVLGEAWARTHEGPVKTRQPLGSVFWRWINMRKGSTRVGGIMNAAHRFCFDTLTIKCSDFKASWRWVCERACWVSEGQGRHFEKWPTGTQVTVFFCHSCKFSHSPYTGCESATNRCSCNQQESLAFLLSETKRVQMCRCTSLANLGKALEL